MSMSRRNLLVASAAGVSVGCMPRSVLSSVVDHAEVQLQPFNPGFNDIVDDKTPTRLLSTGHLWSEGPAWDRERQKLYFTDVPRNRAYSWSKAGGETIFLSPSGVAAELAEGMREPGANGLLLSRGGDLLICNHGSRAVEAREFLTGKRRVLASKFEGKRFNSPNDVIEASDGTIYFTDPPYGLEGLDASPLKQMSINGVYRLSSRGALTRIVEDMSFPNGVALSPDERWLYVSQSDPKAPLVRRFEIGLDGVVDQGGDDAWFNASAFMHEVGGLPDGMAVTRTGHMMLAGPGGVLVISPDGECLGRIFTGRASANCTFGEDGRTLFITAGDRLLAIRTKVPGQGRF